MAEIELVIKIDEEDYKIMRHNIAVNNPLCPLSQEEMVSKVAKGTPLPKGHGRLIDAEEIANEVNTLKDNWNRYGNEYESGRYESYDYAVDTIEDAPTIIEADKEEQG